ncbi:MAG: hypothetical protein QOE79_2912 [Sphingomonadales bacterium]|nr:hypothetical protein [Sphingomonadales bacterium]
MTSAIPISASAALASSRLTLAATRCWRHARDEGRPVHAALYKALDAHQVGTLAPVFASLIALYESCSGRPILVGEAGPAGISSDESHLLGLLDGPGEPGATMPVPAAAPGLGRALAIAVQSARIMIGLALEPVGGGRPPRRLPPAEGAAAYRTRSLAALVDMLRAAYRVTARILGDSGFDAAARAFARRFPPADSEPAGYGRGFADFLAEQAPAADIPYLADVATLERLWTEANLAPDAPALELGDLGADDDAVWTARRLPLHPAARFVWLSTPAVTIWSHGGAAAAAAPARGAEGALFTRRRGRVALRPIGRPEHRLLFGLRLGERVGQAAGATASLYPEADVASLFAGLIGSGAFASRAA